MLWVFFLFGQLFYSWNINFNEEEDINISGKKKYDFF